MRQPQQLGHNHSRLPKPQVFGLQSREQQIGALLLCSRSQQPRHAQRVARANVVACNVDSAVRALGQRFADSLPNPLWPRRQHNHLAAELFLELQRLFESVSVRLVESKLQIAFFNTTWRKSRCRNCASRSGDLFDSYDDFHSFCENPSREEKTPSEWLFLIHSFAMLLSGDFTQGQFREA